MHDDLSLIQSKLASWPKYAYWSLHYITPYTRYQHFCRTYPTALIAMLDLERIRKVFITSHDTNLLLHCLPHGLDGYAGRLEKQRQCPELAASILCFQTHLIPYEYCHSHFGRPHWLRTPNENTDIAPSLKQLYRSHKRRGRGYLGCK